MPRLLDFMSTSHLFLFFLRILKENLSIQTSQIDFFVGTREQAIVVP